METKFFPLSLRAALITTVCCLCLQACVGRPAGSTSASTASKSPANNLPPPVAPGIVQDQWGRVSSTGDKKEVPCPSQDARTAVILTIGQSNAANYASRAYRSRHGRAVLNWFEGRCYIARSPLLGADGPWGEYWTELGNRLVSAGAYNRVILISSAIGGTKVSLWQKGGTGAGNSNLNAMLMDVIDKVQARFTITHVLWHQGESDYDTSKEAYIQSFLSLVSSLRDRGVSAPIYVSITSVDPTKDLPVVQAQRELPALGKNIYAGVDTNALVKPEERNETGHFGPVAQEKVTQAWMEILAPKPAK